MFLWIQVSSTFILEVIDVNELPMKLTLVHTMDSSTPFPEDAPQIVENLPPSTHIGQVIVNDPDNGEEISLQILSASLMFKKEDCIPLTKVCAECHIEVTFLAASIRFERY